MKQSFRVLAWLVIAGTLFLTCSPAIAQEATDDPTQTPSRSRVISADIYVRGGPGNRFVPVGQLVAGDPLIPLNRSEDGNWIMIVYSRSFGWIRRDLAEWSVDVDALPILASDNLTPTPQPGQSATPFVATPTPTGSWVNVGEEGAFLRAGPGLGYHIIGSLDAGASVEPVSRDVNADWILIRRDSGFAWIARNLVEWSRPLLSLPVMRAGALTPSATSSSTPAATRTARPTQTRSATPTFTATSTRTASPTNTITSSPTRSSTRTPTITLTRTATPSATQTTTRTPRPTATPSHTATRMQPTASSPAIEMTLPSGTPTPSPEPTATRTNTPTPRAVIATQGQLLTVSLTATVSSTPTASPSIRASSTRTQRATRTGIATQPPTDEPSATSTRRPTRTSLPTETQVPSATAMVAATTTATAVMPPTITATSQTAVETAEAFSMPDFAATATRILVETSVALEQATATPVSPTAVTRTETRTATPAPTRSDTPTPSPAPVPASEDVTAPAATQISSSPELIVGVALIGLVIAYVAIYWRGASRAGKYAHGFVIERCPVCDRGNLRVDPRTTRILGIPRIDFTVRCDECRSVLREVGDGEWRYAVDPLENTEMFERMNNRVVNDEQLKGFAMARRAGLGSRGPRPPMAKPSRRE